MLKKIIYFSDGYGRQYKNYKNFMNEPSLTSMREMFLKISYPKVRNLSTMDVAIL